jgi:hypothetical protein
MVSLART